MKNVDVAVYEYLKAIKGGTAKGGVNTATADTITVRQGGIVKANGETLNLMQSGVVLARTQSAQLTASNAGLIAAGGDVTLDQSNVRMLLTKGDVKVDQGGAVFTLADFAFASACNSYGQTAVALEVNINFLEAVKPGTRS